MSTIVSECGSCPILASVARLSRRSDPSTRSVRGPPGSGGGSSSSGMFGIGVGVGPGGTMILRNWK